MDVDDVSVGGVSTWIDFFKDAGIPTGLGANYAVLFCDHRITTSVLGDLTREILFDMGVKAMGDVIAILKHADLVSREISREKTTKLITKTSAAKQPDHRAGISPKSKVIVHASTKVTKPVMKSSVKSMTEKSGKLDSGKAVFDRLGKESPPKTVFKRLAKDEEHDKSPAVFRRLGEPVVSSTSPDTSSTAGGGLDTKHVSIKKKTIQERLGPERAARAKAVIDLDDDEEMDVDESGRASPKISVILPDDLPLNSGKKRPAPRNVLGKRSYGSEESSEDSSDSDSSDSSEDETPIKKMPSRLVPTAKRARIHKRSLTDSALNNGPKIVRRLGSKLATSGAREWDVGKGDQQISSSTTREWDQDKLSAKSNREWDQEKVNTKSNREWDQEKVGVKKSGSIISRLGKKGSAPLKRNGASNGSTREWDSGKSNQQSTVSSSVREWDAGKGKKMNKRQTAFSTDREWDSGKVDVTSSSSREWDAGKTGQNNSNHKRVKSVPSGVQLNKSRVLRMKKSFGNSRPVSSSIVSSSSGGKVKPSKKSSVFSRLGAK